MRLFRGFVLIAVGLVAAVFIIGALFRVQIAEFAFRRAVERNIAADPVGRLEDGLHVFMCGAGTPLPDPLRGGPCLAILAGDQHLVIDAGSGGVRTMTRMGYPVGEVDAVFLTHLHSDHMDGLGELLMQAWVTGGRGEPLPIHGPPGVEEVVSGFNAAYRIDGTYRTAHHGPEVANPAGRGGSAIAIDVPAGPGGRAVVYDAGGVTVTAFRVDHAPVETAFGYRVDYKGRSVVLSGDTIYNPNLVGAANDADILFHDALNTEMVAEMQQAAAQAGRAGVAKILGDIPDYHATPEDAAKAASEAGVRQLVFYHTIPPLPSHLLDALFMKDAKTVYDGPMEVAEDGFLYSLPAGNGGIQRKKAF